MKPVRWTRLHTSSQSCANTALDAGRQVLDELRYGVIAVRIGRLAIPHADPTEHMTEWSLWHSPAESGLASDSGAAIDCGIVITQSFAD
jgi:hypothetical protein